MPGDDDEDPPPHPMQTRKRNKTKEKLKRAKSNESSPSSGVFPPFEATKGPDFIDPDVPKSSTQGEGSSGATSRQPSDDIEEDTPLVKMKDEKKADNLMRSFMSEVLDMFSRRDRFNERNDLVITEESVASSDGESIKAFCDKESKVDQITRFKQLLAKNKDILIKLERDNRFQSRLPKRDTTRMGQFLAKFDVLCLRIEDEAADKVDAVDDIRLVVWKRLRVIASGLKEKGGERMAGLQSAIYMFKDIIDDDDHYVRNAITQIPDLKKSGQTTDDMHAHDEYAAFRYLEMCAEEQDIGMTMDEYRQIKFDENQFLSILDIIEPDIQDELGQSIVHIAVQYCNAMVVEKMIGSGFDITLEDCRGFTPLFYAVIANNISTLSLLLKQNADINHSCTENGRKAIHIAAQYGALDAMKLLIEYGANIDSMDNMGHTPIIISSYYSHSEVSVYLLEQGANPCIEDKFGVLGAMRIAFTMPTITREVFNQFVSEDIYQGERYYQLDRMLSSTGETNTSLYHYLVWLSNMGLVEHPIFERLTSAKWELYGKKHANMNFTFLGFYLIIWSVMYVLPHIDVHFLRKSDIAGLVVVILAFAAYVCRAIQNTKLLRKRYAYTTFLRHLFDSTYRRERVSLHFKGTRFVNFLERKYERKTITFLDDVKSSPAVLVDFVVDNLLLLYLLLRLFTLFCGNSRAHEGPVETGTINPDDEPAVHATPLITYIDLYGACTIMVMWISCFFKLQITKKVGPFVVYMRYCGKDLSTIATMFTTLYIPAACVFFKTVYFKSSWVESLFLVLRMVLIDYDYETGIEETPIPFWWMIMSMAWIIVSSVIVLNLLIALMADSYSRIFETAELYARIERARFIIEYERTVSKEKLESYDDKIRLDYAPQIVTFDPVCDRDKMAVIEETVETLSKKFDRLESNIENKIMRDLQIRLNNIDQTLTLYSFRS